MKRRLTAEMKGLPFFTKEQRLKLANALGVTPRSPLSDLVTEVP